LRRSRRLRHRSACSGLIFAPFATASPSLGLLGGLIFAPFATASPSLGLLGPYFCAVRDGLAIARPARARWNYNA